MGGRWVAVAMLLLMLCVSVHAAVSSEERLATLASKMLELKEDLGNDDYVMDCGPATEVLNMRPTNVRSSHYCVLNASGKTIVGTFDDPTATNVQELMLRVYNDTQFYSHVDIKGIKPTACDNKGLTVFEECVGAISPRAGSPSLPPMYVYIYDDELSSGGVYMLISDMPLASVKNTKTFFGAIQEFFERLFA